MDATRDEAIANVANWAAAIIRELEKAVIGKRDVLQLVLAAVLADGHLLLEDVPGVAKTLIARSLAQVADINFARVQFTPDLVPADITGSVVLDRETNKAEFRPGPIFANLVLGDEINRAPPKTQAAILEAMEERQVTADGVTYRLPQPFLVIATQNPIEQSGTYPLPEAQLDRFLFKLSVGFPAPADESAIVLRRAERRTDATTLDAVVDGQLLKALQRRVEEVYVDPVLADYIVAIVNQTRTSPRTQAGASPRGSLALLKASRAWAAMQARDFVTPDDVVAVARPCLAHRLILNADDWIRGLSPDVVIDECLHAVPTPRALDR